ncbi:MAG: hypothetical protein IMF11_12485 [Proteobacteria bacterium]|nr:hypothetical protein [Pseudomonadota bacterium]
METNEIFNDEGSFVENWRETLPEDIKADKTLGDIKDLPTMARMIVDGQKLVGKKGLTVPGEGATPEEINTFHTAIGRPEKASDYKFEKIELPKGMVPDEKMEGVFRDIAHRNGLNQTAASEIVTGINNYMIEGFNTNNKAIEEDQKAAKALLEKKWGNKSAENWKKAERAFKIYVPDPVKQEAFGEFGNIPILIEAFLAVAEGMSEDTLKGGGGGGVGEEALKKIREIKLDPKHPFNIANDPKHDEAVAEVSRLYKQGYPDGIPKK